MQDPIQPPFTNERVQLLRTVQQHHVQLSGMADQKASILVAASLVVLTIIFGRSDTEPFSPTLLVLATFTLGSAFFAALAVLPRCHPESGRAHKFNILFFGSYSQLSEREFTSTMMELLGNDRAAIEAMIHDIYQLGTVLYLKKYRYLIWSYRLFLVGLACTAFTWLAELLAR
ncbi:MAG: DUF5706 domain-containing protein [Verrucomicrobia bacterium]|nr:DUF5706 domain-containing protein [Verrucomicrobiota bacterium]MDA1007337.1 DUF5706 domain-containing protein [Verrucomicrobiota bacterium]